MRKARLSPYTYLIGLGLFALLWGVVILGDAQAGELDPSRARQDSRTEAQTRTMLTIDSVAAFSSSEGAIFLSGTIDCPVGASFELIARIKQAGTGGPVATSSGFSNQVATGILRATNHRLPINVAHGSTGSECQGEVTMWTLAAYSQGLAAFTAGPAEACVQGTVVQGGRAYRPVQICRTVELVGG
jgi:hypothetical protein